MKLARLALFGAAIASTSIACGSDFAEKNQVHGVRILAARADLPYAHPGETVKIEALVDDPRQRPEPMRVFWFPTPCINPPNDFYYSCYPAFASMFPAGVDLTPSLHEGRDITIEIPENALEGFKQRPGQGPTPVVTAYVFMIACAGHVERVVPPNNLGPNALPVGCFSADRRQLDADNFVFGFTRVFVFQERRNALPVLEGVTIEGRKLAPAEEIRTGRCIEHKEEKCENKPKFDVLFNDANAEPDVENVRTDGTVGRETIYVDWFTTIGKFDSSRTIVFDPFEGRPEHTYVKYEPPKDPGTGKIWAVLHDNRGGTAWMEFPIRIE